MSKAFALKILANLLLGSGIFDTILGLVRRWAQAQISGAEKRENVLSDLTVSGVQLSESAARLGVELAVNYLKAKA
jgi:hypothetical protein